MNLLGSAAYDPAAAVSKATSSLLALTAVDTTNLRLAITVPAHGKVLFRMACTVTGATTLPTILLGVLNGATVVKRQAPQVFTGTENVLSQDATYKAEFIATGLTPGAMNVDAAYAVQVVVAATNIKFGGPNDTTGNDAWGAFIFEAWDPQPLPTATPGAAGGVFIAGTNAATSITTGLTAHIIGTVDTLTTYTGNTPQTGDSFARIGALGAGLTGITGVTLAASQPGVTIPIVTTVTNQLTAAAIATAHWQDTTAGDFTVAASIGKSVMNGVALGTGLTINGYTGNTVQTGDSFARIGAAGASLTGITGVTLAASQHVIVDSGTVTTLTNLPSITAGWLTAAGITAGALNGKGDWLLSSGYTAPPSAATIAGATWDVVLSGHLTAGTTGAALNSGAADPWATALPGAYGVGTAGKIIGTNLDATISSRTKPADTQAAVTTVTTVTGLTAANLDVAVSSRPSLGQMIGAFIGLH